MKGLCNLIAGTIFTGVVAGVALFASSPAVAAEEASGFTLNPNIGRVLLDDRDLDNGKFGSFGVGYRFDNPWAVEINYTDGSAEVDGTNADVDINMWRLNGLYHLTTQSSWKPFVTFGAGSAEFEGVGSGDAESVLNAGLGAKYQFTENNAFRAELLSIHSIDESVTDAAISMGWHYTFGARPVVVAATPAPVQVADSDKDGVVDSADRCPATPAGVAVDARGCALDSDRDGVADYRDECPDTFPPAIVDTKGCYKVLEKAVRVTLKVEFDSNSAALRPEHRLEVRKVAEFMDQYPQTRVTFEGHTDSRGAAAYNQQLSERRATAIAGLLVSEFGISADRVSSIGIGEGRPVASNDTAEGRQHNRRVVAEIETTVKVPAQQ